MTRELFILLLFIAIAGCGGRTDSDLLPPGAGAAPSSGGSNSGGSGGGSSTGGGGGVLELEKSLCRRVSALACFGSNEERCLRDIQRDGVEFRAAGCGDRYLDLLSCFNSAELTCDSAGELGLPPGCDQAALSLFVCMDRTVEPAPSAPSAACDMSASSPGPHLLVCKLRCETFSATCDGRPGAATCWCGEGPPSGSTFIVSDCDELASVAPSFCG